MRIVRGEYRNPKLEYVVHVPDGIAEILGDCSGGIGTGFQVSLAHPESGEGPTLRNQIIVFGSNQGPKTFQQIIDAWNRGLKDESERNPDPDLQLNQPEQTSLSSLPALHFKSAITEREAGRIICEQIIANSPDKGIIYSIMILTPIDQYEKNKKLFKEIVDGFRYKPNRKFTDETPLE